jgi:hypothetical protein
MKSSPSTQYKGVSSKQILEETRYGTRNGKEEEGIAFTFIGIWSRLALLRLLCSYLHFMLAKCLPKARKKAHTPYHDPSSTLHSQSNRETHLLAGNGVCTSAVSLLGNGKLDTLTLGQRYPWLLGTDDENVALTGSEGVVNGILDVDNVETSIVTLSVSDDTNTTHVATTSDHSDDTGIELDVVLDLAGSEIDLDGVVDLDGWVRVTDTVHKISSAFLGELYSNR